MEGLKCYFVRDYMVRGCLALNTAGVEMSVVWEKKESSKTEKIYLSQPLKQ